MNFPEGVLSFPETVPVSGGQGEAAQPPLLEWWPGGRLLLAQGGRRIAVHVRQCFPWSQPHRQFSLRDEDDEEVALIEDPASLDEASRRALEHALAEAAFVFEVSRIVSIEEEIEIRHWTVDTRQGRRAFQTHLDDWPRDLPGGGLLIRDVAGDIYHLANPAAMDRVSQRLLWAFVD